MDIIATAREYILTENFKASDLLVRTIHESQEFSTEEKALIDMEIGRLYIESSSNLDRAFEHIQSAFCILGNRIHTNQSAYDCVQLFVRILCIQKRYSEARDLLEKTRELHDDRLINRNHIDIQFKLFQVLKKDPDFTTRRDKAMEYLIDLSAVDYQGDDQCVRFGLKLCRLIGSTMVGFDNGDILNECENAIEAAKVQVRKLQAIIEKDCPVADAWIPKEDLTFLTLMLTSAQCFLSKQYSQALRYLSKVRKHHLMGKRNTDILFYLHEIEVQYCLQKGQLKTALQSIEAALKLVEVNIEEYRKRLHFMIGHFAYVLGEAKSAFWHMNASIGYLSTDGYAKPPWMHPRERLSPLVDSVVGCHLDQILARISQPDALSDTHPPPFSAGLETVLGGVHLSISSNAYESNCKADNPVISQRASQVLSTLKQMMSIPRSGFNERERKIIQVLYYLVISEGSNVGTASFQCLCQAYAKCMESEPLVLMAGDLLVKMNKTKNCEEMLVHLLQRCPLEMTIVKANIVVQLKGQVAKDLLKEANRFLEECRNEKTYVIQRSKVILDWDV
ncbi:hypothetical protein ACOME3_003768 [Neoechinorhynchus agilis]